MKNKLKIGLGAVFSIALLSTLAFALSVKAEDGANSNSGSGTSATANQGRPLQEIREEMRKNRLETRDEIKQVRTEFQNTVKENREVTAEMLKNKRMEIISDIHNGRELFRSELETIRKEAMEKREENRAKFEESLGKIKDEARRGRIENIAKTIPEINTKLTEKASSMVDRIEAVLISVESRADKAQANGADTANVRALITSAENAIAEARTAIANQAGKVYDVTIVSDTTAKSLLESTRNLFRADIKSMNEKIRLAHTATKKAVEVLKALPNVDDEPANNESEADDNK